MTPHTHTRQFQNRPSLRWIFQRDTKAITCELDTYGEHDFDVCVVPHWDVASSSIERFHGPTAAFLRHAEIAQRLRENGWMLTGHAPAGPIVGPA